MKKSKLLLAAAVAGLLGTGARAADKKSGGMKDMKASEEAHCYGVNKCKGTGKCGGEGHSCAGSNSCKGMGWLPMPKDSCLAIEGGSLEEKKKS